MLFGRTIAMVSVRFSAQSELDRGACQTDSDGSVACHAMLFAVMSAQHESARDAAQVAPERRVESVCLGGLVVSL